MHPTNSARDGVRILIVDDAPIVRESLRWLLEDEPDITVVGDAATGNEALAMAVNLKPDLILLDIELPDMDGFAVARQIKAQPDASLIILLSMHNDELYRKQGMDAGCDAYVGKEMGWNGLLMVLRKILAGKE
jgi:DNA-binding NarL/FixJ family response regulator